MEGQSGARHWFFSRHRSRDSQGTCQTRDDGGLVCAKCPKNKGDEPGTSKSTRQMAGEMGFTATSDSVRNIAKLDLGLSSIRRKTVQLINEATRLKRLTRFKQLIRRLTVNKELKDELSSAGLAGAVIPVKCDLRNEEEILSMFEFIRKQHGGVDLCINNAGIGYSSTLLEGTTEHWKEMIDVNVLALCICTREAVKLMQERKVDDGQIVHISSMNGHRLTDKEDNFYTGTKHAVRALTEGLRSELRLAQNHIRVASISPANVYTDMTTADGPPTYRFLDVSDITDALIYLLSAKPHAQVHDILLRSVEQAM